MATATAGRTATHDDDRRRRVLLTVPFILLVLAGLLLTSTALYSDVATVTDNTVSTGSLDLTAAPATQAYNVAALAPGDVEFTKVTLENLGTLDLRHSMTSTTTNDPDGLAAALDFSVAVLAAPGDACTTQAEFDAGTPIRAGGALGSAGGTAIYGDPAQGAQAGDRQLAAGALEGLCLRVELPAATTGFEAATTTVTFTFDAEQVANNP